MRRERLYKRIFEITPGLLTWSTIITLIVLSVVRPLWAAIFVITFDLYWVVRIGYFTSLLVFAYRRLEKERRIDWLKKSESIGRLNGFSYTDVYQAILFPVYKEGLDVLTPPIEALLEANYPKERMVVVFTVEERAGPAIWENIRTLEEKYKRHFMKFLITRHPDGLSGELKGKGANATWGAKALKEFLDSKRIDYERVILSCFDADTCVQKEYFGCLAYHYLTNPKRTRSSYQPIPVYNNNIWHARSVARVLELCSSFMQMIESMRYEKFVTFSSHSMSFKTLVDIGYWPLDMVSDDSVIYWKCFLHYNGDYSVIPLYVTVSLDIATARGVIPTIIKQYKQKRRWAWGVENFPYLMMGFMKNGKIPLGKKIRRAFHLLESHYTWAMWATILTFIAPLPLIFGGGIFRQTAIGYNLPSVSAALFRSSLITLFVCAFISVRLLPPRPKDVRAKKIFSMFTQWLLLPFVAALIGSTPAIDAQTRLMFGRYMHFYATEKFRRN